VWISNKQSSQTVSAAQVEDLAVPENEGQKTSCFLDSEDYKLTESEKLFSRASEVFPGGTTRVTIKRTPVPIFMDRGEGAYQFDVDGNRYLDFVNNYTVLIHGHGFQPVSDAVCDIIQKGSCFANPTNIETELAELLIGRVPAIEKIRFMNTGTEAVMFAVKAARAFTGRPKIAKLEGAYHGAYDWVEVSENSSPDDWGTDEPNSIPFCRGVPQSVLKETVVLPMNDVEMSRKILLREADNLACILVDMMPSRAGLVPLTPEFIQMLQEVAGQCGIILVSDEVLNFRYGYEGISAAFGFKPDLITFGKIIGGGLPIGAVGGSQEVMSVFDSSAGRPPLPHGGTFAANPISMAAGLRCMEHLTEKSFEQLSAIGGRVRDGICSIAQKRSLPISVTGAGSMFKYHLLPNLPKSSRQAYVPPLAEELHKEISQRLLSKGIMLPSDTSACCSTPMTSDDIERFLASFDQVLTDIPDIENRVAASLNERWI